MSPDPALVLGRWLNRLHTAQIDLYDCALEGHPPKIGDAIVEFLLFIGKKSRGRSTLGKKLPTCTQAVSALFRRASDGFNC